MPRANDRASINDPKRADDAKSVLRKLLDIQEQMQAGDCARLPDGLPIDRSYEESAINLLGYLCLRRHELRPLQAQLTGLGVSSLAGCEAHALSAVSKVIASLCSLTGEAPPNRQVAEVDLARGRQLLTSHTEVLLGAVPAERPVRIMVTLPDQAADDPIMVRDFLQQGMDCARINCAHGDPERWRRMAEHVRSGSKELGRACKVVMDLAGPKLRTGPIDSGPSVLKVKPERDKYGRVTEPARFWLASDQSGVDDAEQSTWVELPDAWLSELACGDKLRLRDARGSKRSLKVVDSNANGCWVELHKTAYFTPRIKIKAKGKKGSCAKVLRVPPQEPYLELQQGETLLLTRDGVGRAAQFDDSGKVTTPASIPCDVPELFRDAQPGQPIWFDDGKIGGRIAAVADDQLEISIDHVSGSGGRTKLRSEKGINVPETDLQLAALIENDLEAMRVAVTCADVIELSFANTVDDVQALAAELKKLGAEDIGVILKIETRKGFENLPSMLLTGMHFPRFGVMIARGDLAVETGFERLAEVQEEILCLCEAAHVPVVWATQVLETLAKKGSPSRAEITDAAMGVRAECVMLNKGPHILQAIRTLDDLLRRMQAHQHKNRGLMRRLNVAKEPFD
ncbi:pyruvate kinase [Halopseudomonas xinjiangensis]|uniref:pyruvate kinase n=1 Tax=Halopseudomonas xinjiangensis TaxID=487184 RepID=A0A1H1QIK3_9GAMM|nr:pyruvate kinase [Halopseudomonas xinjiangensis]SDS23224.1 pyruvate kinase [Halopseudomonas xinjiangensis]